jgi:hypothetical protein
MPGKLIALHPAADCPIKINLLPMQGKYFPNLLQPEELLPDR